MNLSEFQAKPDGPLTKKGVTMILDFKGTQRWIDLSGKFKISHGHLNNLVNRHDKNDRGLPAMNISTLAAKRLLQDLKAAKKKSKGIMDGEPTTLEKLADLALEMGYQATFTRIVT